MPARQKILIVDDKMENIVALRHVLNVVDADIIEATTGNQALSATFDHQFAAAILDVEMPGMSGYELAEHLRGDEKTRLIPILFLTARYGDEQEIFKGYEVGAVDYLTKPYSPEILRGKLRIFLEMDLNRLELQMHRDHLETLIAERTRELDSQLAESRQLEKKLSNNEARLRLALESINAGVWDLNLQDHSAYRSLRHDQIFGYQDLLPIWTYEMFLNHVLPSDQAEVELKFNTAVNEKHDWNIECRIVRCDGMQRWIKACGRHNLDNKNLPKQMVGIVEDITERKQAEEELKQKNTEIEQFIYTVSHDLRSPLVTVKTFMGYLEKDLAEGNQEQLTQDIQFIHGAADKMKMLLDELLELSRIGRIETVPVRESLRELVKEALTALAGAINERKIDIELPETDLILFGDRPRLCQIWQNLIENAVRYSRDDTIRKIECGVQRISGETVFFVKDNGIGIDPQYLKKIFGIFEKLDQKSPGAGMGLALVQRIVEKCGGNIWVESEGIGKGACFFFTLPLVMDQAEPPLTL